MTDEPKLRTTAAELRKQSDDAFEYGADIAAEYLNKAASTIDTLLAENARLRADQIAAHRVNVDTIRHLENLLTARAIPPELRELSERAKTNGGAWVKFYIAAANFVWSLIASGEARPLLLELPSSGGSDLVVKHGSTVASPDQEKLK